MMRLLAALASKRFLILTGLAGSGKTKLAQAFARWITPKPNKSEDRNPHYAMVPIGADWTGNENVLGYPNGLDERGYVTRPALDLILHAKDYPDIPHVLILDEMNLSHVERYFADVLSAIESEEPIQLHGDAERKANDRDIPKNIALPNNLFIIGTVNVDETTYMFSPKVLDRANVIEFRMEADELQLFLQEGAAKPDLGQLDGKGYDSGFGKPFVDAAKAPVPPFQGELKEKYGDEMLLFFKVLQGHGAEFGYRVAHEAARFVHFYKLLGNHPNSDTFWFPGAFDCVVVQKFLPKLHGSRPKLAPLLKKLWFLCVNGPAQRGSEPLKMADEAARSSEKTADPSVDVPSGALYPLSAEKIGRMWRLLNDNGFASFAEA
jgi:5-methylcytosine-specific restriction protein B